MGPHENRDIRDSISTINHELGAIWRELEKVATHVLWLRDIVWKGFAPVLVGIVILLVGILLKLLLS